MTTKIASVYDPATGLFMGRRLKGAALSIEANTPAGMAVVEGNFDHLSQRVDIQTGQVVDYQPPAPDDDHEWENESKRWRLKPEIADQRQRQARARARIVELEVSQQRPLRELYMDPNNTEARRRIEAIEAAISELRAAL